MSSVSGDCAELVDVTPAAALGRQNMASAVLNLFRTSSDVILYCCRKSYTSTRMAGFAVFGSIINLNSLWTSDYLRKVIIACMVINKTEKITAVIIKSMKKVISMQNDTLAEAKVC